jgi:hypothetical protein
MCFSKDELYEIEKVFDCVAVQVCSNNARQLMSLSKYDKNSKQISKHIHNIITESINAYDMCRTISAKAKSLRCK